MITARIFIKSKLFFQETFIKVSGSCTFEVIFFYSLFWSTPPPLTDPICFHIRVNFSLLFTLYTHLQDIQICMYACICIYVCIYVCMYVCMHACMYVSTHACMQSHVHAHADAQEPSHAHSDARNMYVCMNVCTHFVHSK